MRKANIALVTVNREDSLTQLVKAHAIKTKPAVIHSYVRLDKFKSQNLFDIKNYRQFFEGDYSWNRSNCHIQRSIWHAKSSLETEFYS